MEFWILLLLISVFSLWLQSRIRRGKEDQRFANVIETLNRLEPRLNELKKLQIRMQELEQRLAAWPAPPTAQPSASQPSTPPPTPPSPKPVELPPQVAIPPPPEIPKPATLIPPPPHAAHPI